MVRVGLSYVMHAACSLVSGTFGNVNGANAGGKEPFRFRRRSTSDAFDKGAGSENGPRNSPPTYGL
ncbi:hypothetical protein DY000_02003270 [Brassica cretica]|uniref:Secreted protein n=1 Tax=Brassica cretica TaxID=69181 RepID=A0ABQ7BSR9_BRACR|nr:hypothetical protein DY000_02003270 [Brassica cretica]